MHKPFLALRIVVLALLFGSALIVPRATQATVSTYVGKILTSSNDPSHLWYISPVNNKKYDLGTSVDQATASLRKVSLGISIRDLNKIPRVNEAKTGDKKLRQRLAGRFLLSVQEDGRLWYVNPKDLKRSYFAPAAVSFAYLQSLKTSVSDATLHSIATAFEYPRLAASDAQPLATTPRTGCAYNNPSCATDYTCDAVQNTCRLAIESSIPPTSTPNPSQPTATSPQIPTTITQRTPPTNTPITGTVQTATSYRLPSKDYQIGFWTISLQNAIAWKNDHVRVRLSTTNPTVLSGIQQITIDAIQMEQNPLTQLGKTDTLILAPVSTENGTAYETTLNAADWYGHVAFGSLRFNYTNGSQSELPLGGVALIILDLQPDQATIYETEHAIAVLPTGYTRAAQNLTEGVERCVPQLEAQAGPLSFQFGKVVYIYRQRQAGYIENGGFVNIIRSSLSILDTFNVGPPQEEICEAITSHELTHSLFPTTPKPVWAEEGLAEYTSQAISGRKIVCESTGWRESSSTELRPYVRLIPGTWQVSRDSYHTGVCVFRAIEDTYGREAMSGIYRSLATNRSFTANTYCSTNYQFYRDVLFPNVDSSFRQVLQDRFGVPETDMNCVR